MKITKYELIALGMILFAIAIFGLIYREDCHKYDNVVLPTCAELDSYGYDGLASCIDETGHILTPGETP